MRKADEGGKEKQSWMAAVLQTKLPKLLRKENCHTASQQWCKHMARETQGEGTESMDDIAVVQQDEENRPYEPSNKYLKLITPLSRKLTSILSQLRMGYVPLAKHPHCISKSRLTDLPSLSTGPRRTTQHFLLHCPAHNAARQSLCNNMGG